VPDRKIDRAVRRKVRRTISVQKPRSVIEIERRPSVTHIELAADAQRIALIVIEQKISPIRRLEIRQSPGHIAPRLCVLPRIHQMQASVIADTRRAHRDLRPMQPRIRYRQWKKDIAVPQCIMVEKIARRRLELRHRHRPFPQWDRQPRFPLYIALPI